MRDTKLVNLLKGLSSDDLRQVRKMLNSPFFTTNKNLLALFNLLKGYHPAYDSNRLEKRTVFKRLFPGRPYSDIKLRNLNSELVHILEDFLIYQSVNRDDTQRRKALIKAYKNLGVIEWFEKESKKFADELDKRPYRDQIYYKELLNLNILQLEHYEGNKLESRYQLFAAWGQLLDQYYELCKVRQQLGFSSMKLLAMPSEQDLPPSYEQKNAQLELYRQITQLFDSEDLKLFEKIKLELEENLEKIRPKYRRELLMSLINFAIREMAKDDQKYNKVVLELYQLGLQHNCFFQNNSNDSAFFNIVVCGSKAKAFDWTLNFINNYEHKLLPETKNDIKTLSLSTYHFHKKEYAEAIDLISAHQFRHVLVKNTSKYHALRCYYESYLLDSSYYELLIAQLDSTDKFFRRIKNLPETKLRSSLNFLNFIRKLATVRLRGKLNTDEKDQMIKELSKQKITLSRSWLIDIINR